MGLNILWNFRSKYQIIRDKYSPRTQLYLFIFQHKLLKNVDIFNFTFLFSGYTIAAQQYLGKFLGKLSELHHGVSGEIYAVDARTLHLKDFTYDGEGPGELFFTF